MSGQVKGRAPRAADNDGNKRLRDPPRHPLAAVFPTVSVRNLMPPEIEFHDPRMRGKGVLMSNWAQACARPLDPYLLVRLDGVTVALLKGRVGDDIYATPAVVIVDRYDVPPHLLRSNLAQAFVNHPVEDVCIKLPNGELQVLTVGQLCFLLRYRTDHDQLLFRVQSVLENDYEKDYVLQLHQLREADKNLYFRNLCAPCVWEDNRWPQGGPAIGYVSDVAQHIEGMREPVNDLDEAYQEIRRQLKLPLPHV